MMYHNVTHHLHSTHSTTDHSTTDGTTAPRHRDTTKDGEERESLLLLSGWWGVARHFHYVPELGLAAALTVPAGVTHLLPWLYWIFLFILLVDRAGRDEKRCAAKYGEAWATYREHVPWRILPGVY